MTEVASPSAGAALRPTERLYTYRDAKSDREVSIVIDVARDANLTEFGRETLADRYLLPSESFQDLFARVACANSDEIVRGEYAGEPSHAQRIYDAISKLWFMPATPVLSNSGTDRGLPISCFLNTVGDNMESIAQKVNENIWLACRGGGIGTSWSSVRSIGEKIAETGTTSGIVPFLHWMGAQTLAISQGSLRRGSAAAYLHISHPEIEEFIDLRDKKGDHMRRAPNLHHGVVIPDAFMEAVKAGAEWNLVSPKDGSVRHIVDARTLWRKLIIKRLEEGEPYIMFEDRVRELRPATYQELGLEVSQSNLCIEIMETTGKDHLGNERTAVCCLSSLNFEKGQEWFDDRQFLRDVLAFLDNVMTTFIDKTDGVPGFENARYSAIRERSIGLGMMGFASMLQKMGIPIESVQAAGVNKRLWTWLKETADEINLELARERGPCPDAAEVGLDWRFTHKFAVAPTASISIICGEVSAGGEPDVANVFTQKTLSGSKVRTNRHLLALLERRYDELNAVPNGVVTELLAELDFLRGAYSISKEDWIAAQLKTIEAEGGSVQRLPYLTAMEKACFKTAFEIDQRWLIEHAADRTPMVCQSQSLNLFLPGDVSKRDLEKIHLLAHEKGVKSLYYVRSRAVTRASTTSVHTPGEMPQVTDLSAPLYEADLECLACQ